MTRTLNPTIEALRSLPIGDPNEMWEVAIITLPVPVQEKGDLQPWHPICAACVSSRGGVMLTRPSKPVEVPSSSALDAVASFAREPHVPGAKPLNYLPPRIHISAMPKPIQAHLTAALAALGVKVEVKPHLPIMQDFVDALMQDIGSASEGPIEAPPLLKAKGMSVERVRAFAEAAALFWGAAPWEHFGSEVIWTIEPRPKTPALRACVVMGGGGQESGIGFFASALDVLGMSMRAAIGGDPRPGGTLWSATYCHVIEAPPADQELWAEQDLPVAAVNAFPFPMGVTEAGRVMRPRDNQLNLMEALLRGFAGVDRDDVKEDVLNFRVATFDGPSALTLRCSGRL